MKKILLGCLILALMLSPSGSHAQRKVYPHLQIFLVSPEAGGSTSFITFWDGAHQLAAGPFPIRLLELAGLLVSLDLSYPEPNKELPVTARLKITRRGSSSSQEPGHQVALDQVADRIAERGVSTIFPDAPFIVSGHSKLSDEVLRVGNVMLEIQAKILSCDKEHREMLEVTLDSMKGMASYDHALRVVESAFPPCSLQGP